MFYTISRELNLRVNPVWQSSVKEEWVAVVQFPRAAPPATNITTLCPGKSAEDLCLEQRRLLRTLSWLTWKLPLLSRKLKYYSIICSYIFSRESDSTFANVRSFVRSSVTKPLNSLKSSSFIIHPSTFIFLHSSFLHSATFKLFSLFILLRQGGFTRCPRRKSKAPYD